MPKNTDATQNAIKLEHISQKQLVEVINLWDENDRSIEFNSKKVPEETPDENPLFKYLRNNHSPDPIRSIIASARFFHNAFALLEYPYLDQEFWESHSSFYDSSFSVYGRECTRLHFFSAEDNQQLELKELLYKGYSEKEIRDKIPSIEYLGYSVLRPTSSFVVGRTALKFNLTPGYRHPSEILLLPEEKKGMPFLTAFQYCGANLLNAHFGLDTPEFIQQDPNLGHCATASLWVANNLVAKKFGTKGLRYGTITRHAIGDNTSFNPHFNTLYNPLDPETGLSSSEIVKALSESGAGHFHAVPGQDEHHHEALQRLKFHTYSFVESGLPSLLCLESKETNEGHVVAAIGHSLPVKGVKPPRNITIQGTEYVDHFSIGDFINLYYAHDDLFGPFNRVIFAGSENSEPPIEKCCFHDPLVRARKNPQRNIEPGINVLLGRKQEPYYLREIVAPLSPMVKSNAWNPFMHILNIFKNLYEDSVKQTDSETVFIWRPILTTGANFKQSVATRAYSDSLKTWYSKLQLPKYIWLFEVSAVKKANIHYLFSDEYDRPIDGEFIFDATCPSHEQINITQRFRGAYWDSGMQGKPVEDKSSNHYYRCYPGQERNNGKKI